MTNSQVKQAIDETIGSESLMDEAFVQKVMQKSNVKTSAIFTASHRCSTNACGWCRAVFHSESNDTGC